MFIDKIKILLFTMLLIVPTIGMAAPKYTPETIVTGKIAHIGSDTLQKVMASWAKAFTEYHKDMTFDLQVGKGPTFVAQALTDGTINSIDMAMNMSPAAIKAFETKYGYQPLAIRVTGDAVGVFVNQDNPIAKLTFEEVDAIFSTTRKCGGDFDITDWSAIANGKAEKIVMFGRNPTTATYMFIQTRALCQGNFKANITEATGSKDVLEKIATTPNGIGYASLGAKVPGTKVLPISKLGTDQFVEPTEEMIMQGEYPLGRYVYIYINKAPSSSLASNIKEFLKFILSAEGQAIAKQGGFVMLPDRIINAELESLK